MTPVRNIDAVPCLEAIWANAISSHNTNSFRFACGVFSWWSLVSRCRERRPFALTHGCGFAGTGLRSIANLRLLTSSVPLLTFPSYPAGLWIWDVEIQGVLIDIRIFLAGKLVDHPVPRLLEGAFRSLGSISRCMGYLFARLEKWARACRGAHDMGWKGGETDDHTVDRGSCHSSQKSSRCSDA
jgi:hypothetical protein